MTRTRQDPARPTRRTAGSASGPPSSPDPCLEAQRAFWEAVLSWQRSLATFNVDLWDQWAVRYAGGMPIDG
jgi:hypothetical protein